MVVLDSWALLAYLKDEPAAEQIEAEWIERGAAVSTINLGEALYMRIREHGCKAAAAEIETNMTVIVGGTRRAHRAIRVTDP